MDDSELTNNDLKLKIILQGQINYQMQHYRQQEVIYRKINLSLNQVIQSGTTGKYVCSSRFRELL